MLLPTVPAYREKLEVMKKLQAYGTVRDLHDGSHGWRLTADGLRNLSMVRVLSAPEFPLRLALDSMEENDMSIFLLMYKLSRDGWQCQETQKKIAAKDCKTDKGKTPKPGTIDYVQGGRRIWRLKHDQKTVFKSYLLCLLACERGALIKATEEAKVAVPHHKTDRFYQCLLEGRPFEKKTCGRRKDNFIFGVPCHDPDPIAAPGQSTKAKAATKLKGKLQGKADADSKADSSSWTDSASDSAAGSDAAGKEEAPSEEVAEATATDAKPADDDDSSSNSRSSSSSSSSSSNSTASVLPVPGPAKPAIASSEKPSETASASVSATLVKERAS